MGLLEQLGVKIWGSQIWASLAGTHQRPKPASLGLLGPLGLKIWEAQTWAPWASWDRWAPKYEGPKPGPLGTEGEDRFQEKKVEHAEFFCFWFKNGLLVKKGVWKSRYCWKKKEKAQNFSPTYQNWGKKKKYFLTFNPQMKSWHMMYKYNFNFRKLCPSLHRDQQWRLSLACHSCWSSPSFCLLCS